MPKFLRSHAKAAVPFLGTIVAVLVQWAATGEFNHSELATAVTGLLASLAVYTVPNTEPDPGGLDLGANRTPSAAHTGLDG